MGFLKSMIRRLKGRHNFTILNMIEGDKKKKKNQNHEYKKKKDQNLKYFSSCLLSSAEKKNLRLKKPSDFRSSSPCEASSWVFHHKRLHIHWLSSCPQGTAWRDGADSAGLVNTSVCFWWVCAVRVCTISGRDKWGRPHHLWSRPVCVTSAWWWWRRTRRRWRC